MAEHARFHIKDLAGLSELIRQLGIALPLQQDTSLLFDQVRLATGHKLANRFVVQPMEGFDADSGGTPGKLSFRRYRRYAAGGAALIWFEACAVAPEARSNPHQFYLHRKNLQVYKDLVEAVRGAAAESMGREHQLILILQLTHSGRYSKPTGKPAPLIAHHSPVLDPLHQLPPDYPLVTDDYLDGLQDSFLETARLAAAAGFDGVDLKSCHRYLVSELHASFTRENSRYGGSLENRTRLLREVLQKIARELPELIRTTRLNVFDALPYPYGFGVSEHDALVPDLTEPLQLIKQLTTAGISLLNTSIGNPYYEPHFGRPYDFPVKGAKLPAMHPLENVAKIIDITRQIQQANPGLPVVGSGYSWLRQFSPYVAAGVIAAGWAALIGQGRNSFAYPTAVKELKEKGVFDKNKVCVSCSACTQIMRDGGRTGCVVRDSAIYAPEYRRLRARSLDTLQAEAARCRNCEAPGCQLACPARVDVPGFIQAFAAGNIAESYAILKAANCFPEACACICPVEVQCEGGCLEKIFTDNPIPIHEIQRKVAVMARELGLTTIQPGEDNGMSVAVLGAGPAGLACAATLLEAGYHVDLYDSAAQPGGTPAASIPAERLTTESALLEIYSMLTTAQQTNRLHYCFNQGISPARPLDSFTGKYDAVFLGLGLGESLSLTTGSSKPAGVIDALTFLKQVKQDPGMQVPATVCVLGGGNTAIDAALAALQTGARDVFVIYRRSFTEMPAWPGGLEEAKTAGVQFLILTQPLDYVTDGGRVTGIRTVRTFLGEPDESGRRQPLVLENSAAVIPAQLVIEALGQQPASELEQLLPGLKLDKKRRVVVEPETCQTGKPGVFAGGDLVNGGTTAVQAISEGMQAARQIDTYCRNKKKKEE